VRFASTTVLLLGGALSVGLTGVGCSAALSDDPPPCVGSTCPGAPGSPTFAGVGSVSPDRAGERLRVTWSAATDDKTPPEQIRYRVYVSTKSGRAISRSAILTSEPGSTSVYIAVAPPGATHHVVVRALDADGLEDANTVEKSAMASPDTTPPVFGGARAVRPEPGAAVTVSWAVASDDRTAPEGMRYAVLDARTSRVLALVDAKTETTIRDLGAPGDKRTLIVRALDAADNTDGNATAIEAVLGPDASAPTFAGCKAIEVGSKVIRVSWAEASDDVSLPGDITYEVFVSKMSGGQQFATPTVSVVGRTDVVVPALDPSTTYYVVCRARDATKNSDPNIVEHTVTTKDNVTAPTFAGATGTLDAAAREVTLTWVAATDDKTPPAEITYAIYETGGNTAFDFARPKLVTPPGVTSTKLTGLASRAELHWVVRARDADLNEDANTTKIDGTTETSWSLDVLPLFHENCSVVGCHAAPHVGGGISFSLSTFNAYESIFDVSSAQRPLLKRVAPGNSADSYLFQKIAGAPTILNNPMPAPGTGNVLTADQVDIIKSWIDQGALRN
jgi:hypothetical protein